MQPTCKRRFHSENLSGRATDQTFLVRPSFWWTLWSYQFFLGPLKKVCQTGVSVYLCGRNTACVTMCSASCCSTRCVGGSTFYRRPSRRLRYSWSPSALSQSKGQGSRPNLPRSGGQNLSRVRDSSGNVAAAGVWCSRSRVGPLEHSDLNLSPGVSTWESARLALRIPRCIGTCLATRPDVDHCG